MKNIILLISLFTCISSCKNKSNEVIITELNTEIDKWHLAAAQADYDAYFGFIADNGIFIGTDVNERWAKSEFEEFSKPYFDRGKAWSFTAKERTIRLNDKQNIAWFDEVLDTWMGDCRSTGVLTLNDDKWHLEHYQLSVTIDNELMPQFLEITQAE